jgi:hypothetical protein
MQLLFHIVQQLQVYSEMICTKLQVKMLLSCSAVKLIWQQLLVLGSLLKFRSIWNMQLLQNGTSYVIDRNVFLERSRNMTVKTKDSGEQKYFVGFSCDREVN